MMMIDRHAYNPYTRCSKPVEDTAPLDFLCSSSPELVKRTHKIIREQMNVQTSLRSFSAASTTGYSVLIIF